MRGHRFPLLAHAAARRPEGQPLRGTVGPRSRACPRGCPPRLLRSRLRVLCRLRPSSKDIGLYLPDRVIRKVEAGVGSERDELSPRPNGLRRAPYGLGQLHRVCPEWPVALRVSGPRQGTGGPHAAHAPPVLRHQGVDLTGAGSYAG